MARDNAAASIPNRPHTARHSQERFARGEIDQAEFEDRRRVLGE
jgi:uncharacterized membrane protein